VFVIEDCSVLTGLDSTEAIFTKAAKIKSGINVNLRYNYAMKRKTLAVAIYDGLLGFEYGIVAELFGLVRPSMEKFWYDYQPCRVERGELRSSHGFTIQPKHSLSDLEKAHTIIVPGWRSPEVRSPAPKRSAVPGPAFVRSLQTAWKNGARIVSICSGAFVLGHAGLLNGKQATAHWLHLDQLQRTFPKSKIVKDRLYVRDGRILSSAGCSAGMDLCLSIIRNDFGVEVANTVARRMVAPTHREGGQSQYVEPTVLKTEDEDFGPVLDWMNSNLTEPFTLDQVADQFALSLRTFQRRFQHLTGQSPLAWVNHQRINKARAILETSDLSIEQVADRSGLGSAANLRKHFKRVLGTTPRAYRSTFNST
jgi:AraC family transcriptional activator FtrA